MKKLYSVREAVYTLKPVEAEVKVVTLVEHVESPSPVEVAPVEIKVLVNEAKMNEECDSMKIALNKKEFKSLFGPKAKPRKGDVVSITGLKNKFKVKSAKKFTAKKKGGKGFKVSLTKV